MDERPDTSHGERRQVPRQKSFLRGQVLFNNRRNAVDCLIRDISTRGARLIFSTSATTPDALEVFIPQKDQTLHAQVIWRSSSEIGVEFRQPQQAETPPDEGNLADRVQRLEAELAALKRLVRRMKADADADADVA
jgi:hypothetical protein